MSTPRSPRDIDDSASDGSDSENEQLSLAALEKQKFLARREVEFDVPDEVWLQERRCLLMLLEARMLLREMVEYKVKMMRTASGNLTIAEIQNLLALYSENDDDADFISGTCLFIVLHTHFSHLARCCQGLECVGCRSCVPASRPILTKLASLPLQHALPAVCLLFLGSICFILHLMYLISRCTKMLKDENTDIRVFVCASPMVTLHRFRFFYLLLGLLALSLA